MLTTARYALVFLAATIVTAGIIYLTPLKWLNFTEPTIHDTLPQLFFSKYKESPDQFIFIDVRPPEAYQLKHAEGSINIPLHILYDERKNLPKNGRTIVLICSLGRASGVAYSYLEHYGFLNLQRISGGIEAWEAAGLPLESGTAVE